MSKFPVDVEERGDASAADVDVQILIGNELERWRTTITGVLVIIDRTGGFADEEIEIAVRVDVDQRRRGVASARKLHETLIDYVKPLT